MPRPLLVLLAVLSLGGFAVTQSSDIIEVFGGYSYVSGDFILVGPNGMNGWNASANFKIRPWVGFVTDFSGFYPSYTLCSGPDCKDTGTAYTFLFGPQLSMQRGRIAPFARFLIGDAHASVGVPGIGLQSNNSFSVAAGGGVDYFLTGRFGLRGQVDWLYTGFAAADDQIHTRHNNNARISTGVVFRF